jgi:sugar phosphate isomerase/epimerase
MPVRATVTGSGGCRPLSDRIGIMQGRLLAFPHGVLEAPVGPRWREELLLAAALGLRHLELVADRFPDSANPIWSAAGRDDLSALADATGVRLASMCVNETLASPADDPALLANVGERIAGAVRRLGVELVVVPLLEASDLHALDWSRVTRNVARLADELSACGVRTSLEFGVSADDTFRFLEAVGADGVGVCYDTGNATWLGLDAAAEIRRLASHVWHVHAKDRNASGENVRFGAGEVAFDQVLAALDASGFDGLVTMEATRGDDPVVTAAEHRAFLLCAAQGSRGRG